MKNCQSTSDCDQSSGGDCHPPRKTFRTIEEIVQNYIDTRRERAAKRLDRFAEMDLAEAIDKAALAVNEEGKRDKHQRRIPLDKLKHLRQELLRKRKDLEACKTFAEMMTISEKIGATIWKKPGLTIYDATQRIGGHLQIFPDLVYLHTGTMKGAKALGFKGSIPSLRVDQLPKAFRRLKPYEIEDCLCIYAKHLERLNLRT
ncbi:MAG TPA: hypothetical protein VK805_15930 [Candidatus Baltobacteraceae bacterium]|jgi:hypothetical protein|nr:hypothetical protein [Candidatus Baltobacteraceae bacterium]